MPAILAIWEKPRRTGHRDLKGNRFYSREFTVLMNAINAGPLAATNSALLPRRFSQWTVPGEFDPGAICKDITCTQREDQPSLHDLKYSWDSEPFEATSNNSGASDSNNNAQNPDLRPPTWSIGSVAHEKVWNNDRTGKPLVSSSNEPFNPGITSPEYYTSINITWYRSYQAAFNSTFFFTGSVNADVVTLFGTAFAPGTLLCKNYAQSASYDNGRYIFQRTIEILNNNDGWAVRVADMGTREYRSTGTGMKYVPLLDEGGQQIKTPVFIKKNAFGEVVKCEPADPPNMLSFDLYPQVNFRNLFF